MTIASRFIAKFGSDRLQNDSGMSAIQWLHDNDPHGTGKWDEKNSVVQFTFTDGSKIVLDLNNASFHAPQ